MEKLSLKKESFVVIMLAVLLTGCRDDVQTEELLQPSFEKMTFLDTESKLDRNVLLYGNLFSRNQDCHIEKADSHLLIKSGYE